LKLIIRTNKIPSLYPTSRLLLICPKEQDELLLVEVFSEKLLTSTILHNAFDSSFFRKSARVAKIILYWVG
jgi:hypothetical protein